MEIIIEKLSKILEVSIKEATHLYPILKKTNVMV